MATDTTGNGERYYIADGERIPLVPSRTFVAVRADGSDAQAVAAAAGLTTVDPARPSGEVITLAEHDLLLIHVGEAVAEAASGQSQAAPAEALQRLVDARAELQPGPTVFSTPDTPGDHALVPTGQVIVKFADAASEDQANRLLGRHKLKVVRRDYPEPGAILAEVEGKGDSITIANTLHDSDLVAYAEPNFAHVVPRLAGGTGGSVTDVLPAPDRAEATSELLAPGVDVVDLGESLAEDDDEASEPGPLAPPSDPAYAQQWGLRMIQAPAAFDISMGSPSISIAIIDEGNDLTHEDLVHKLPGYDAYAGDDNPTPNGNDAHGTACAGVAAATANNGKGGSGVAPRCRVLPVRIAQGVGGGFWDTSSAKVADGIRTAVDRGADVLSNSYSVGPSSAVTSAFQYAQTNGRGGRGCPTVAATGNGDVLGVIYPARLSPSIRGFLAVGASNEWDQRKSKTSADGEYWWGSNFGPEVDVIAPGVHIYTTDIMGGAGYGGGNYAPTFNGTSSATPHVAGLAGLILSVDPELRSWEVEDIIKLTADDLGTAGRDEHFGFGRINARRALEAASKIWYSIAIRPVFYGKGRECYMHVDVRMYNPGVNWVRLDSLTLTSHNPTWTREIDRFTYLPNPGGTMAPRSGQDVRHRGILLRANGNSSSWSYRWALGWTYTYWRPSNPAFPLSAGPTAQAAGAHDAGQLLEAGGRSVTATPVRGSRDRQTERGDALAAEASSGPERAFVEELAAEPGARSITITIR